MIINYFINKILSWKKRIHFKNNVTLSGTEYIFGRSGYVSLSDSSTKDDVVLGNHVWIYGALQSQNHGKIFMGNYSKLGVGCRIQSVESVVIGDYTAIADGVTISDNNNHPVSPLYRQYMRTTSSVDDSRHWKHSAHAPVIIGKNCWIGQNARIQKGVVLGDNCIVAANSVVTKSAPANCILAGNPARIVKTDIDQVAAPDSCEGYNEYIRK